ncbi:MAG: hypothetical protein QM684_08495 [Rhizobium sp.]
MMNSRSALAMIIIGLFAMPAGAAGIDCTKPASSGDRMICRDKSLLARDAMMKDLYAAALKQDDAARIRDRQRRWVATVQACGDAACIRQAYDDQIGVLLATKGGRSASKNFMSKGAGGNEGNLAIFGPVDGLVAVSLASTYVGPGGADAGDVNADGMDGVAPLTNGHIQLSRDSCRIALNRIDAKTWRVSQSGVCNFADGVTLQGTYGGE